MIGSERGFFRLFQRCIASHARCIGPGRRRGSFPHRPQAFLPRGERFAHSRESGRCERAGGGRDRAPEDDAGAKSPCMLRTLPPAHILFFEPLSAPDGSASAYPERRWYRSRGLMLKLMKWTIQERVDTVFHRGCDSLPHHASSAADASIAAPTNQNAPSILPVHCAASPRPSAPTA